jgi:hypothetical protein
MVFQAYACHHIAKQNAQDAQHTNCDVWLQEAEACLHKMLDAAGKSREISMLIRKSFILSVRSLREKSSAANDSAAWEDEVVAQAQVCH